MSDAPTDLCQCPCCGRMHRHLGTPSSALDCVSQKRQFRSRELAERMREALHYRREKIHSQRKADWFKRMIADARN